MPVIAQLGLSTVFVLAPVGVLAAVRNVAAAGKLSPIIWCYILGIVAGNAGIIPESAEPVQELLSSITVTLSIPLLLFTVDLRRWGRLSGTATLSLGLAVVAIAVIAAAAHFLFRGIQSDTDKIAGLLVGVYTGGTPNLAAIRTALSVDSTIYVTVHTADVVIGGVYLLFLMTIAKPVFTRFLKPFAASRLVSDGYRDERHATIGDIVSPGNRLPSLLAFGLSAAAVGVSLGIAQLLPSAWETIVVILLLTTLALAAAAFTPVRRLRTSFAVGEYIILVFAIVVGSMADAHKILTASPTILLIVAFGVFGSLGLHLLLCRLFGVDADTMIITSTSAICSPPFVGMIGVAIGNRALIAAGITTGIIGYAIGNYLGIGASLLLGALG